MTTSALKLTILLCLNLIWSSAAFSSSIPTTKIPSKTRTPLQIFKRGGSPAANQRLLPKVDPQNPDRFLPPDDNSNIQFYSPTLSLLRGGPLPFITRVTNSDKYEQAVLKYMFQSREPDVEEAQANMDAFFSAPDVWAEQKMLEQQGKREVFRYSSVGVNNERAILSGVWGVFVIFIVGKLVYGNLIQIL